jgi:hypothetical protein
MNTELFVTTDGRRDYGQLIRTWRKHVRGWRSAEIVVSLYNEALIAAHEPPVSVRWWQHMEKENAVPMDEKRRRLIQILLGIPPTLLGLPELVVSSPPPENTVSTVQRPLDLQEYGERLTTLWRTTKKQEICAELVSRIHSLQNTLLYGSSYERETISSLLCEYLIATGNTYRYHGYFSTGIEYLDKAITLAQEKAYADLQIKALYIRGFALFNQWTTNLHRNHPALLHASRDFATAAQLAATSKVALSPSLRTAIATDGGRAQSYRTQDIQDRRLVMKSIDSGAEHARQIQAQHIEKFLRVDAEWVHITKAEALIGCGWYREAITVLDHDIIQGDPQAHQRYLYANILGAEANIGKGWHDIGMLYLDYATTSLGETTSRRHLPRIMHIHQQLLSACPNSQELARLNIKLLRIHHPELFIQE